jgi:SAM-dependent methyltransferase
MSLFRNTIKNWLARAGERIFLGATLRQMCLVMGGHIYFQTLSAAVQLDLFTQLARKGPLSREAIAAVLGIAEKPARILLLGCSALGLVRRHRDGRYGNTRLADVLLNSDHPRNFLAVIRWQHFINYRAMFHFGEAIRENRNVGLEEISGQGQTLYERLSANPELEKIFQDAMQAISVQANHLLVESVDFSRFSHVLDVGGGNATNIINLASRNPGLRASVFDWPSVCAIAADNIRIAGLEDRLNAVCGNCFSDPFPAGTDCILFCHFMTIWSDVKNRFLLRKAYEALPPGGVSIIFNMMQDDTETGPLSAAMGSPYFLTLATGEGMLYTWSEYESWMREAGFRKIVVQKLIRDHGVIVGIK